MAASTTMPTAKAMPAREMTLSDRPTRAMATKVAMTEMGMAITTTRVARHERRKSMRTSAASTPPTKMFCSTNLMAELM